MSETKKRKKPGPKKIMFTEDQLKEAQRLAGLGFSEEAICQACLGCSPDTLLRRKKEYPEIAEYIRRGKMKSIEEVSNALYRSAIGLHGKEPSVSAQIFFLKNKGKQAGNDWADIQQVETNINLKDALTHASNRIIQGEVIEQETLNLKDAKD
jgi:hypothetical protein